MNKYYVPDITELYVGFKCEMKNSSDPIHFDWEHCTFKDDFSNELSEDYCFEYLRTDLKEENIRVKYLDREDIESLGFNDKHYNNIQSRSSYFKIKENNDVYQIAVYWHMLKDDRESLIRIYKGKMHNYPYTEIFRGEIKNKSELKVLLNQLKISE